MTLFGLPLPDDLPGTLRACALSATCVLLGFVIGGWLIDKPIDRESALGLFVGTGYALFVTTFTAMDGEKSKRYVLAATGAGVLLAAAALMEQFVLG